MFTCSWVCFGLIFEFNCFHVFFTRSSLCSAICLLVLAIDSNFQLARTFNKPVFFISLYFQLAGYFANSVSSLCHIWRQMYNTYIMHPLTESYRRCEPRRAYASRGRQVYNLFLNSSVATLASSVFRPSSIWRCGNVKVQRNLSWMEVWLGHQSRQIRIVRGSDRDRIGSDHGFDDWSRNHSLFHSLVSAHQIGSDPVIFLHLIADRIKSTIRWVAGFDYWRGLTIRPLMGRVRFKKSGSW